MWDPFKEVKRVEKDIEKSFKKFFHHNEKWYINTRGFMKALSTFKSKGDNYEVSIKLPGVEKKDVIVKAHDRVLEVSAEKSHKIDINKKGFFQKKRSFGRYYRVIPIPKNSDVDKLKTEFKKEILKVTIPKQKAKKKRPMKIKIS